MISSKRRAIYISETENYLSFASYVLIVHPSGPELVSLYKGYGSCLRKKIIEIDGLTWVKSFHDLTPYAALKLGLSLVNPTLAIRAIVAIMLGQPGGASSLFQTFVVDVFSASLAALIKYR